MTTTTLHESIKKEYSNLAEDTGGFIFFYNQEDRLQHIRYASDLPRAVSLCKQKNKIPTDLGYQRDENGSPLTQYSYGKQDSTGGNRGWGFMYNTPEFNQWCDTEKRWFKYVENEITYIKVYPYQNDCHTGRKWLNTAEFQRIKELCMRYELPPVEALKKQKEVTELERKESMISEYEAISLRQQIEQLQNEINRLSRNIVA
tara:strand:- start:681 stop:1286 length:606 start_codon:yes stop_codon:yes gene_type:complete